PSYWPSGAGQPCWTYLQWNRPCWSLRRIINGRVIAVARVSGLTDRITEPAGDHCGPAGPAVHAGHPAVDRDQAHQADDDGAGRGAEGQGDVPGRKGGPPSYERSAQATGARA